MVQGFRGETPMKSQIIFIILYDILESALYADDTKIWRKIVDWSDHGMTMRSYQQK